MVKRNLLSASTLAILAAGLYLVLTGIQIMVEFTSQGAQLSRGVSAFFGGDRSMQFLPAFFAVLEILSGAVLLLSPFGMIRANLLRIAFLIVLVFWAARIVLDFFVFTPVFGPTVMLWLKDFAGSLLVLAVIWMAGFSKPNP